MLQACQSYAAAAAAAHIHTQREHTQCKQAAVAKPRLDDVWLTGILKSNDHTSISLVQRAIRI